ncbi:hypothetical protein N7495_005279 [Penicillium taxi]|uniref:uncharacterized protein n=1 Tax=Penicillium taxi TaxID=168475 RepID=UPI002544E974|nr:uncharacterized protein N7495_005279 [Penicillium taxi]KAJ5893588.1 hypothetical protein N7495_005279 [Penicillium taxi]
MEDSHNHPPKEASKHPAIMKNAINDESPLLKITTSKMQSDINPKGKISLHKQAYCEDESFIPKVKEKKPLKKKAVPKSRIAPKTCSNTCFTLASALAVDSDDEDASLRFPKLPSVKHPCAKVEQKKKKSRSKRAQDKPTGFEDWATDAPITVEEAEYESRIYDPGAPFIDRLDDALIRFQMKRRFDPVRRNIFMKYLQYGGITVSQNYGTGIGTRELREMKDEDAARARSQTMIELSRGNLDVDFDLALKGYFSSFFLQKFRPENLETIKLATVTIKNFYNYLLYHNVCPEHKASLERARKTCDEAEQQLWKNMQLVRKGPGRFNLACAEILGPDDIFSKANTENDTEEQKEKKTIIGLTFKLAITVTTGDSSLYNIESPWSSGICPVQPIPDIDGFEVISVKFPSPETKLFYTNYQGGPLAKLFEPVGIVHAKPFMDPAKPDIDMGPIERKKWESKEYPFHRSMNLPVEISLLPFFYPGQKVLTKIFYVSSSPPGFYFCGDFMGAYPSFYTVLGNDLMVDYKPPREKVTKKQPAWVVEEEVEEGVDKPYEADAE